MEVILETVFWILGLAVEIYWTLVIVQVAIYWCMHLGFIGQGGDAFKKFLAFLHQITEPVYAKLREKIKPVSGFDVSPYVLIVVLGVLLHLIENLRAVLIQG